MVTCFRSRQPLPRLRPCWHHLLPSGSRPATIPNQQIEPCSSSDLVPHGVMADESVLGLSCLMLPRQWDPKVFGQNLQDPFFRSTNPERRGAGRWGAPAVVILRRENIPSHTGHTFDRLRCEILVARQLKDRSSEFVDFGIGLPGSGRMSGEPEIHRLYATGQEFFDNRLLVPDT